jgi:hypothetical protein
LRRTHHARKTLIIVVANEGVLVLSENGAPVGFPDHHAIGLALLPALPLDLAQAL